jgi:hypothetical protein
LRLFTDFSLYIINLAEKGNYIESETGTWDEEMSSEVEMAAGFVIMTLLSWVVKTPEKTRFIVLIS